MARPGLRRTLGAAVWVPCLAAPVFLALLVARWERLVAAVHANSDGSAPALIAESLGRDGANGGPTILGDISYATTLLLFAATRGLPSHRALWDLVPVVFALAGAALLAWSAYRLAGRWAGALTLALGVAIGSDALFTQIAPAFHGSTWFTGNLLAAFLVALATGAIPARRLWLAAGVVGVVVGLNLASDPLLALTGLAPFVLAAWLGPRGSVETRRLRRASVTTAGIAVVVAVATGLLLALADIRTRRAERGDSYLVIAEPDDIVRHLDQLWRYTLAVFGAGRGEGGIGPWPDVPIAVVALLAVGLVLFVGLRASWRMGSAAALAARFWAIGVVLLAAGFVLSGIPDPDARIGTGDGLVVPDRYLVPAVFAVAAVVPVWAAGSLGRRVAASAGAAVLTGAALAALATADLAMPRERLPVVREASGIASFLRAEGISRGFSDYWTSHALTYKTGIPTRAIIDCDLDRPVVVPCPLRINARAGWYRPQPGPSFVIVDTGTDSGRVVGALVASGALGRGSASRDFGPLRVHVFAADVASRLRGRWGAGAA